MMITFVVKGAMEASLIRIKAGLIIYNLVRCFDVMMLLFFEVIDPMISYNNVVFSMGCNMYMITLTVSQ